MTTYLKYNHSNSFSIYLDKEYKKDIGHYEEDANGFITIYIYKNKYTNYADEIKFKFNLKFLTQSMDEYSEEDKERCLNYTKKYWEMMNKYVNGIDCNGNNPIYTYATYNPVTGKYRVFFVYNDGEEVEYDLKYLKHHLYISIMNYGDIYKAMEKAYNNYIEEVRKENRK